ncbi:MAG: ankyrin repeat domain-containing protein [Planctomycetota bacterium]|nr:ankyrin repeat domain-containing protein [Planctomycetota bacterium]
MPKQLPQNPSIKKMQELAEALKPGQGAAIEDPQLVIAREHGFASWRQLEVFLLTTAKAEKENPQKSQPNFQQLGCLNYCHEDSPSNWERARTLLKGAPSLASQDIWSAATVGDAGAVKAFLDLDASLLNKRGGYFDWEPLMYACYSRVNLPNSSTLDVARLLIERGADPNVYYMWGGQYKFTALTGVFGEGEGGLKNLPEHEQCEALARLLLEAGANPNDSQALYNRMFTDGSKCLEMLLEYGLSDKDRNNWLIDNEEGLQTNPEQTLRYQLGWAVNNHHTARAKLLINHGANLSTGDREKSFYESAMIAGNPELADYLLAHGAEKVELDSLAQFACACMSGDQEKAISLLEAEPDLMKRIQDARPGLLHDAARSNRLDAVREMADLGANLDLLTHNTALHEAAWGGHLDMVKLLLARGANLSLRDNSHCATALQWAVYSGKQNIVDYLATCDIDIFDAIVCENLKRVESILESDSTQLEITLKDVLSKPDPQEFDWKTPLASAVTRKHAEIVCLLLKRGANTDLKDSNGKSLIELAEKDSTPEIVKLLQENS